MNRLVAEFAELVGEALKVFDETYDCRISEPYFLKVLYFIKSNPGGEKAFKAHLIYVIENSKVDFIPLVAFCMHELKWDEIKEATIKKITRRNEKLGIPQTDPRSYTYEHTILEAYDADWEDCVFYEHYKAEWK